MSSGSCSFRILDSFRLKEAVAEFEKDNPHHECLEKKTPCHQVFQILWVGSKGERYHRSLDEAPKNLTWADLKDTKEKKRKTQNMS